MTRRTAGEGTIRKRADGRWEARIRVEMPGGGSKRVSIFGKTEREVRRKLLEARHRQAGGLPAVEARETVGAFLDRWLATRRQRVKPNTARSYEEIVRLHLKPAFGNRPLAKLEPRHVEALISAKLAEGMSPRRAQLILVVLRMALKSAERQGEVARNVAALVDGPTVRRPEIRPLTPAQARAFLEAIKGHRHEALFLVAVTLGLRLGEILGLRWEDVDLEAGRVRVRNALVRIKNPEGVWVSVLAGLKTESSRRTLALSGALPILRAHRARQSEARLRAGLGERREEGGGFVFADEEGGPLSGRQIHREFQRVLFGAGLPHQRLHDLRHLSASLLIAQGASLKEVQGHLGHSTIVLTGDTYSHLYDESQRALATKMDAILGLDPGGGQIGGQKEGAGMPDRSGR